MDEKTWNSIAEKTGLPGGEGHRYYEEIRDIQGRITKGEAAQADLDKMAQLIKESEKYYSNFYGF